MIGASDGRSYNGKKVYGVSVFDFKLPNEFSKAKFLGYSCIPDINCRSIGEIWLIKKAENLDLLEADKNLCCSS